MDSEQLADIVAEAIEIATAPLVARIADLESSEGVKGVAGRDGHDGRDGTRFTTGVGAPVVAGHLGDVYLDSKTGDLYEWR